MKSERSVIALDVGGTKTACGLFLESGEMLFGHTVATPQESAGAATRQIVDLARAAIDQAPRSVVAAGVGVAVPGWVDHRARTVWAPNVAGWDRIPLESLLSEELPLPLVIESDRAACVAGEAWLGAARGLEDVVFLAVGTGIGAGILAGGRIVRGRDDLAGAVGWMALDPRYRDEYARVGCFEAEASGAAVARRPGAPLDDVALYLGMGVANLVSTLDPEMVVLGGGLFVHRPELVERVRVELRRWAQPFAAERVRVEPSALGERAGLAGAARLAFLGT